MPWIDLHGHAGRCFLAGLPAGHQLVATMGAAAIADAVRDAQAATAVSPLPTSTGSSAATP